MVVLFGNSMESKLLEQKCIYFCEKKVLLLENFDCLLSSGYKRSRLTDDAESKVETEVTMVESKESNV